MATTINARKIGYTLRGALDSVLAAYRQKAFKGVKIIGDGDGCFTPLGTHMAEQGIEFNVQTPGEHTCEAERSVRSIKEVARAVANRR
jgi:hypothetical protein